MAMSAFTNATDISVTTSINAQAAVIAPVQRSIFA